MSSKQGTTRSERKQGGGGGPSGMTTKEFNKSKKSAAQTKYEAQLKAGKKKYNLKLIEKDMELEFLMVQVKFLKKE